jgi:radical SAM protein (TIGR01212 family)
MIKPVTLELGLQTIHKTTADYIRRGYDLEVFDKAVKKLHEIGIEVVTHIIIGLPFETEEMILESVEYAGRVTDGIKLQLLHIIKGTDLEIEYRNNKFEVLSLEKYTDIICKSIELLPKNVVIHRITGDGDKKSLIAPLWSADKKRVLNYINKQLDLRNVKQGSKL